MSMLTSNAISGYRNYTMRTVSYARVKAGGTWYKLPIQEVTVTSSGVVEIAIQIDASVTGATTVTEIQLWDTAGNLWASKAVSLSMSSVAEGFAYVFQLAIREEES